MQYTPLVNEERLEANSPYVETQRVLPELLYRLVSTSVRNPTELRIPYGGGSSQPGWDGVVNSPMAFNPYVPEGASYWEFGSGENPQDKATADFKKRDEATPAEEKASSTFVFVTSRSGTRTWNLDQQRAWLQNRADKGWKEIRIIDGTKLAQWLTLFPEIDFWLAGQFGLPTAGLATPALHWHKLRKYGEPPPLKPDVFTTNRDKAKIETLRVFEGQVTELRLESRYPAEGVDFVCAVLAGLDPPKQAAFAGRCLLIKDQHTWEAMCSLKNPHVLIADPSLDVAGNGSDLRQLARSKGHQVIFTCTPSSSAHGNAIRLGEYRPYELEKSLVGSGYRDERARQLASRSGGSIVILKRILLDVSASPDWAVNDAASDLKIGALIGGWDGDNASDRQMIEGLVGKAYGEWIGVIRQATLRPDPPLMQRNEKWKFISRYEGWQFLGPLLSNDDLERFRKLTTEILQEPDTRLELPPDERWAAGIRELKPRCSNRLREGIAETLALLGSYVGALSSVSAGRPRAVAEAVVRDILSGADWKRWASQGDLPLLAEAAPEQFLRAVEDDLDQPEPSTVVLFSQETSGFTGRTYMTGLLWALETLAWNPEYLLRVTRVLAKLAARDPGGNWSNRPFNSLATIFLPWLPQTMATREKRHAALRPVLQDFPTIGWKLLLELLPDTHQSTSGSQKPTWREWIAPDTEPGVTESDYSQDVQALATIATTAAIADLTKLGDLVERLNNLPISAFEEVLRHLASPAVVQLPDADRFPIWQKLLDLVAQHRRHPDAEWAMPSEVVQRLENTAAMLAPRSLAWRHRRWFSGRDYELFEDVGNHQQQQAKLAERRRHALDEIMTEGGLHAIVAFAQAVSEPWKVGHTFASLASAETDAALYPKIFSQPGDTLRQFMAGYTWARFWQEKWAWVRHVLSLLTAPGLRLSFIVLLPFEPDTWSLAKEILGGNESDYWRQTNANPYESPPEALPVAITQLLEVGRATAALQCFDRMQGDDTAIQPELVASILEKLVTSRDPDRKIDGHDCRTAIAWLQKHPPADRKRLQQIEWAFLPLLDRHSGASPKTLAQELADNPEFYCEAIRTVFRAEGTPKPEETDPQKASMAENAYRLLRSWRIVPGYQAGDHTVDEAKLKQWFEAMKAKCTETGHLKVAMSQFGHVLAHSPADRDGTWICHPVARLLDAVEAKEMRNGFSVETFNSRGAHFSTRGKAEKEVAAGYRNKAETIEATYPRLAATMRDLATTYERMAERAATEDALDD